MTASAVSPYLDNVMVQATQKPSGILLTNSGQPVETGSYPATEARTLRDRILDKARSDYKKLLYGHMYPYGFDFVVREPISSGLTAGSGVKTSSDTKHARRTLKNILWKLAMKKAHKKIAGKRIGRGDDMPERPKTKSLPSIYFTSGNGVVARGDGVVARGDGVVARGDGVIAHNDGVVINEASSSAAGDGILARGDGYRVHGAHGGFLGALGTIGSMAASLVTSVIPSLVKGFKKGIAKIKERREERGRGQVPTPYQMKQASDIANRNAREGRIGFPNPLSFPKEPPTGPVSAIRSASQMASNILTTLASNAGLPPKRSIPLVEKLIRKHLYKKLGKGATKRILYHPGGDEEFDGTAKSFIRPLYKHLVHPRHYPIFESRLHHPALAAPMSGQGLGNLLNALAGYFIGSTPVDMPEHFLGRHGTLRALTKYLMGRAKHHLPHIFRSPMKTKQIKHTVQQLLDPELGEAFKYEELPELIPEREFSESEYEDIPELIPEGHESAYYGHGKLLAKGGGKLFDMIKNVGRHIVEYGAPILGSIASEFIGDDHSTIGKAVEKATKGISKEIGKDIEREADKAAADEALEKLKKEHKEAVEEYKKAREITPDEYKQLRTESEYARTIAELLKNAKLAEQPKLGYDPIAQLHELMGRRSTAATTRAEDALAKYRQAAKINVEDPYAAYEQLSTRSGPKVAITAATLKEAKRRKKAQKKLYKQRKAALEKLTSQEGEISGQEEAPKESKKAKKKRKAKKMKKMLERMASNPPLEILPEEQGESEEKKPLKRKSKASYYGTGVASKVMDALASDELEPSKVITTEYKLKPVRGITYGVGRTTAESNSIARGRRRAATVLMLSKKTKGVM